MVLTCSGLMRLLDAVCTVKQIRSDWDSPGLRALVCGDVFLNAILASINFRIDMASWRMLLPGIIQFCYRGRNTSFTPETVITDFSLKNRSVFALVTRLLSLSSNITLFVFSLTSGNLTPSDPFHWNRIHFLSATSRHYLNFIQLFPGKETSQSLLLFKCLT